MQVKGFICISIIIAIGIIISMYSSMALASGSHHHNTTVNKYISSCSSMGLAASALNFDARTYSLQGSGGIGSCDGENSIAFGLGKRIGKDGILVNGSVIKGQGQTGLNMGFSFKFR